MNVYHCMIDLKDDAKALAFANAMDQWMEHLKAKGAIRSWRLMRRKLNLASDRYRDFMLVVEFEDMSQMDQAFRVIGSETDEQVEKLHDFVQHMIGEKSFALYRSFPDPERVERLGLV